MKRISLLLAVLVALFLAAACGNSVQSRIEGPILSIDQAQAMLIDQLYINGGLDDEFSLKGEFSIYLRDAATDKDVACSSQKGGMEKLSLGGIWYGNLSVPLTEVEGSHPGSIARFKVVFVEKDSEDCPKPIDSDDDIAGISAEFEFGGLLGQKIWATDGRAAVVFRDSLDEALSIGSMAPALTDGLSIDRLYFEGSSEELRYYIFVDRVDNGVSTYLCQIEDSVMENIRFGNISYAALGFSIPCLASATADLMATTVKLSLYVQRDSGTELVGETAPKPAGELVGEKVPFTGGNGYISFRSIMAEPFSPAVVRLADITKLGASALSYSLSPSANPRMELEFIASPDGFVLACSGSDQELKGVEIPGIYADLSAKLVAAEGQKELFGWDRVVVRLVERTDGLRCPDTLTQEPTVLAASDTLSGSLLGPENIRFLNGAGSVTFDFME